MIEESPKVIWTGQGKHTGVTIDLRLLYNGSQFFLEGEAQGYGKYLKINPKEVKGNIDWVEFDLDKSTKAGYRIKNWKLDEKMIVFDLWVWGKYGISPWLPIGGYHFHPNGSLIPISSLEELERFLKENENELNSIADSMKNTTVFQEL